MRVAVIGRGTWGGKIVRTLATMRDVELTNESKNLDVVLRHRPAGVLIATPSETHAEVAIPFIDAGIPTFIEKPMATTVADASRIREAALRSGAPVVVGHVHLFNPAFQAAKKLLPEVGAVQAVFWEGMNNHPRTDSSVLWDWFPHGLSMAQSLFNANPVSAQAWGVGEASGFESAIAKFVITGVPFIANASWVSPLKRHRMTIPMSDNTRPCKMRRAGNARPVAMGTTSAKCLLPLWGLASSPTGQRSSSPTPADPPCVWLDDESLPPMPLTVLNNRVPFCNE